MFPVPGRRLTDHRPRSGSERTAVWATGIYRLIYRMHFCHQIKQPA